ncbi:DUF2723 domain-containing protein [Mucilaginibacter puniceus]
MEYKKINNLLGWLCFVIAAITYILTLEPTVSFWDCGEFISCAYRLQVSHQPGYPLFAMLGKVFSLLSFGDNTKIPYFTNMGSAIASAAAIMFLFWTITAFAKKLLRDRNDLPENIRTTLIMGAGLVGALAFTFSDTFWFSAVETIVFALSALCTAIVFWAILKWDAHADEPGADKWLIFIAYIVGLSIGIHLLNLLTIPAITLVYYFRRSNNINKKSAFIAFLISIAILGAVQFGIRQFTIKLAAYFDLFFVNTLGFGFNTGAIVFFVLLVAVLVAGIIFSIRKNKPVLNLAFLCVAFIYFGYSSFVYIPIRATANTNLNNTHVDNAFTLNSYLNRDQYGSTPLFTGPYFDSEVTGQEEGANIYRKGETKYELAGKQQKLQYDRTTIFPRMYSDDGQDPMFYRQWMQIGEGESPTFATNLGFFFSWQTYQMYFRYFFWNFAGRINEMKGQEVFSSFLYGYVDGDWTTGFFDKARQVPKYILNGTNYMPLYGLPLVIGLIGMIYHFKRKKRDALIIALLWFFTGIAIVIYVNQPSVQPRERDYSYVCSFYAFAIWIGLGVIAIADFLMKRLSAKNAAIAATVVCLLTAPVVMAKQEWRGHDRSTKWTAHDMAYNYLISCPPNAILFTYGDNDTYSLWYVQEVENIRPDVRIVNLSLFTGDWYIHQMQYKMNQSEPLPITMPFKKYKDGTRDFLAFNDSNLPGYTELKEVFDFITSDDERAMVQYQSGNYANFLPTKKFKITVNKDDVLKNNVVTSDQKDRITDTVNWTFTGNFLMKDDLATLDILAHNNWKRPICFTTTLGLSNLKGLQPYLYKEGFTYRLLPLRPDTALTDQLEKTNTAVMYNNVMNKFKFGNYKNARYLDHESRTMFYPVLMSTFYSLSKSLIKEGKNDMALKVLHKYDEVMPDLDIDFHVTANKYFIARTALQLHDHVMATKMMNSIDNFIVEQLDYNYYLLQKNSRLLNTGEIQYGMQLLTWMIDSTKQYGQSALFNKLQAQHKDYEAKFGAIIPQTIE